MIEAQREAYREEAHELLGELEISLLALEEFPGDAELIGRVFRALHTIKGSGAMFGFDDIAAFTHEVETVFDLVRNEKMAVTKALIDLTLAAGDRIRATARCLEWRRDNRYGQGERDHRCAQSAGSGQKRTGKRGSPSHPTLN